MKRTLNEVINSLTGKIAQSNFDKYIDENQPLQDQLCWLTEDMLLIEFENDLLLDVSWRMQGFFLVRIIQNCDWENPLLKLKCRTFTGLKRAIKKAHTFIVTLNKK